MSTLVFASSAGDLSALEALERHHAELTGALATHVASLVHAGGPPSEPADRARRDLVDWAADELLPAATALERTLLPAARESARTRLLATSLGEQLALVAELVARLGTTDDPLRAIEVAASLRVTTESLLSAIGTILVPELAAAPEVPLAELVAELLASPEAAATRAPATGAPGTRPSAAAAAAPAGITAEPACGCGEHDDAGYPELDARTVPHAIRHATVFGALDAVAPGGGLELVAPHDPLPLLAQVEQRDPGAFDVSYLERGPQAWRLRFLRRATSQVG